MAQLRSQKDCMQTPRRSTVGGAEAQLARISDGRELGDDLRQCRGGGSRIWVSADDRVTNRVLFAASSGPAAERAEKAAYKFLDVHGVLFDEVPGESDAFQITRPTPRRIAATWRETKDAACLSSGSGKRFSQRGSRSWPVLHRSSTWLIPPQGLLLVEGSIFRSTSKARDVPGRRRHEPYYSMTFAKPVGDLTCGRKKKRKRLPIA
jgi:hypothetical protein